MTARERRVFEQEVPSAHLGRDLAVLGVVGSGDDPNRHRQLLESGPRVGHGTLAERGELVHEPRDRVRRDPIVERGLVAREPGEEGLSEPPFEEPGHPVALDLGREPRVGLRPGRPFRRIGDARATR